jgi:hypothetical protein
MGISISIPIRTSEPGGRVRRACRPGRVARLGWLTFVLAALAVASARAQSPSAATEARRALARQHYDRARELVRVEHFVEAAAEFRLAYETLPNFQVLYNLAQAHVALGEPVEAMEVLSRYLSEGGDQIAPARRTEVELQIAGLRALTAELVVTVEPQSAVVTLDDRAIPRSALVGPIRVSAKPHVLAASASGYTTKSEQLTPTAEQRQTVAIRLEPIPETKAAAQTPRLAPPPPVSSAIHQVPIPARAAAPPASNPRRTLAYVLGGAGALLGGVALGVFLDNDARFSEWKEKQESLDAEWEEVDKAPAPAELSADQDDNDELGRSIEARDRTTWILGIGAGALLATGVVLFATSSPHQQRGRVAARFGSDQAGLVWETVW